MLDMLKTLVMPTGWKHLVDAHNLIVDIDPSFGGRVKSAAEVPIEADGASLVVNE
jgi:hypothetical protein